MVARRTEQWDYYQDETTLVSVTTETKAVFSSEKRREGQFLGATTWTETKTAQGRAEKVDFTGEKKIDYAQAVHTIGIDNFTKAVAAATPGRVTHTLNGMGQTVLNHPVRVIGGSMAIIGGVLALPINPSLGGRSIGAGIAIIGGAGGALWCTAGGPGC